MPDNDAAQLLNEIGQLLAEDAEYPIDGTLLYAEVDKNFVAPSIFKDLGDHVLYRGPDLNNLGDALLDLWEAEDAARRWREIEYIVRGNKFHATFVYPEEIDPDEEPLDRRNRTVAKYFGQKRIVYPTPPDDAIDYEE